MLHWVSAKSLVGCAIHARDGDIGKVREFYFDDETWAVRYVVVDVGHWLLHKNVLLAPSVLGPPNEARRIIAADVTRDQVRHSPRINTDMPVAIQHQAALHQHYGWEFYWGAEALLAADPAAVAPLAPANAGGKPFDPHLRTTRVVTSHRVQASDGPLGQVRDVMVDTEKWVIAGLSVEAKDRREYLVPPALVERVSFEEGCIYLTASRRVAMREPLVSVA